MEIKTVRKSIRPLVLIFVITSALFIAGRSIFERWGIDNNVLIGGNILLFFVTLLTFYLYTRSMASKNAYAITRTMYGSLLARMFIVLVAVFVYAGIAGKGMNKGGILGCVVLYFVYTGVEVAILMKLSKQQKNA